MKIKKLLLPMFGLGLALAVAQPAAAGTEVSVAADTVQADVVTVKVENRNWLDMRIYAIVGGFAHRLGTVGSFRSEEFTLRKGWVGPSEVIRMVAVLRSEAALSTTPKRYWWSRATTWSTASRTPSACRS